MTARDRHVSVGSTTDTAALSDLVTLYRKRSLDSHKPKDRIRAPVDQVLTTVPTMAELCVKHLVDNFEENPVYDVVPSKYMHLLTAQMPVTIDPSIAAKYIFSESYWKRRCVDKYAWHNCQIEEHGLMWKQLYYEKYVQEVLEAWSSEDSSEDQLLDQLSVCAEYVFTLTAHQLLGHPDMSKVCAAFPNLCRLRLRYSVRKTGMEYERILFGMKISDAQGLTQFLKGTQTLTTLELSMNLLDDDLLRMLMVGLISNETITHLDVSHNRITNHGARLLSKLLGANSVITSLDLSDNLVHSEGGRYLARGLRDNASLVDLNLRLNRLTDEGGKMLAEGCRENVTLTTLNLSANSIGSETVDGLSLMLRSPRTSLTALDLSANDLTKSELKVIKESISRSSMLKSIDLRNNKFDLAEDPEVQEILDAIRQSVQGNEIADRDTKITSSVSVGDDHQ